MAFVCFNFFMQDAKKHSLCVALLLLYCVRTSHCASSVNVCPLTPTTLSSHPGHPTLADCTVASGNAFLCSVQCSASTLCKAVVVIGCDPSGQCICIHCNQLTQVDFGIPNAQFFLHTHELGRNTNHINFPNHRLYHGQPLLAEILPKSNRIGLNFYSTVGFSAFHTEIRFDEGSVVSNSLVGIYWGAEDRYTPHFNFQQDRVISMFCVVTSTAYYLYLDGVLFKNFPHRIAIEDIAGFVLSDVSNGASYIVSFRL